MRTLRTCYLLLVSLAALSAAEPPSYVRSPRCNAPSAADECTSCKSSNTPTFPSSSLGTSATMTAAQPRGGVYGRVARAIETDYQTALLILRRLYELSPGLNERWAYDIARETARWSRNTGVRWQLIVAVMWHESRFNPSAVSRTNDHGLMQLHGRPIHGIAENIRQGAAHLAGCLAAAGGDERRALGHYNGGNWCNTRYAEEVLRIARADR